MWRYFNIFCSKFFVSLHGVHIIISVLIFSTDLTLDYCAMRRDLNRVGDQYINRERCDVKRFTRHKYIIVYSEVYGTSVSDSVNEVKRVSPRMIVV